MNTHRWRLLLLASFATLTASSLVGAQVVTPVAWWGYAILGVMLAAFVLVLIALPSVLVRLFLAAQVRIGNAEHPMVALMLRRERRVVQAMWLLWALGAAIAVPVALRDWLRAP